MWFALAPASYTLCSPQKKIQTQKKLLTRFASVHTCALGAPHAQFVPILFTPQEDPMTRVISIYDVQRRMANDTDYTEEHQVVLGEVLLEMANGRRRDAYSNYVPHLQLDRNPPNRRLISEVLGFLWEYCQQEFLPEFNYMIVEKRSGYPGKYMKETWKELYGKYSMRQFEMYCDMRASESVRMLNQGFIKFDTENMITR
jgi:hypothetical protein